MPFFDSKQIILNGAMASNITSTSVSLEFVEFYSIEFIWSSGSSPVGTITVEHSNDNLNFVTVANSSVSVSNNSGSAIIEIREVPSRYCRAVYTVTSGSGTLNATFVGKGL